MTDLPCRPRRRRGPRYPRPGAYRSPRDAADHRAGAAGDTAELVAGTLLLAGLGGEHQHRTGQGGHGVLQGVQLALRAGDVDRQLLSHGASSLPGQLVGLARGLADGGATALPGGRRGDLRGGRRRRVGRSVDCRVLDLLAEQTAVGRRGQGGPGERELRADRAAVALLRHDPLAFREQQPQTADEVGADGQRVHRAPFGPADARQALGGPAVAGLLGRGVEARQTEQRAAEPGGEADVVQGAEGGVAREHLWLPLPWGTRQGGRGARPRRHRDGDRGGRGVAWLPPATPTADAGLDAQPGTWAFPPAARRNPRWRALTTTLQSP